MAELFYLVFNDVTRDGTDRIARMNEVAQEFNAVIRSVFDHYELVVAWDRGRGLPIIQIRKTASGEQPVPIEDLSLGEQEVFGLLGTH